MQPVPKNGVESRQKARLCEYIHLLEHPLNPYPDLENMPAEIGRAGVSEIGRVIKSTNLENKPAEINSTGDTYNINMLKLNVKIDNVTISSKNNYIYFVLSLIQLKQSTPRQTINY